MGIKSIIENQVTYQLTRLFETVSRVCPMPPTPNLRVLPNLGNLKYGTIPVAVPVAKILTILVIGILSFQLAQVNTFASLSAQPAYVYTKNSGHYGWGDFFSIDTRFTIPPIFLSGSTVEAKTSSSIKWQTADMGDHLKFNLVYYCNDILIQTLSDEDTYLGNTDAINLDSKTLVIPSETLGAGINKLTMLVSVDLGTGNAWSQVFSYNIDKIEIRASNYQAILSVLTVAVILLALSWGIFPVIGRRLQSQDPWRTQDAERKSRSRIYRKIFLTILLLATVSGTLSYFPLIGVLFSALHGRGLSSSDLNFYLSILQIGINILSFALRYVLPFLIMYLIGTRIDLKRMYTGIVASIFLGAFVGYGFLGLTLGSILNYQYSGMSLFEAFSSYLLHLQEAASTSLLLSIISMPSALFICLGGISSANLRNTSNQKLLGGFRLVSRILISSFLVCLLVGIYSQYNWSIVVNFAQNTLRRNVVLSYLMQVVGYTYTSLLFTLLYVVARRSDFRVTTKSLLIPLFLSIMGGLAIGRFVMYLVYPVEVDLPSATYSMITGSALILLISLSALFVGYFRKQIRNDLISAQSQDAPSVQVSEDSALEA